MIGEKFQCIEKQIDPLPIYKPSGTKKCYVLAGIILDLCPQVAFIDTDLRHNWSRRILACNFFQTLLCLIVGIKDTKQFIMCRIKMSFPINNAMH